MSEKKEADVSVFDKVQQLRFVFQPILSVTEKGSEIKRYETLLRYGESTSFPACLFNELISSEENCNVLNAWYEKTFEYFLSTYPNVQFSVNIDMKQMAYDSTWEMLKKISRFTVRISIELTEFYQLMPEVNHQLFIDSMAYFRSLGLGVAFDDVGNGQHSMGFVTQNIHQVDYGIHLNNYRGGQLAAEAIIQGKTKNVIIVAGPAEVKVAAERLSGAISVLNANQLTYKVIHTESYGIEEAKALAADFFTRFPDVDSIIASNDIFALALINQANQHGISVPDQLQIVGFDNIPYSQLSVPSISTIEQFARKIGYEGAELLFRKILNKPITEKKIVIEPVLVERESLRKA